MSRDADKRMEQEQIAHARQILQDAEQRSQLKDPRIGGGATMGGVAYGTNESAMCARETARMLIMHNIDRLDRERAGLVALLDYLHPNMHVFAPQADEALFEMVSRRR